MELYQWAPLIEFFDGAFYCLLKLWSGGWEGSEWNKVGGRGGEGRGGRELSRRVVRPRLFGSWLRAFLARGCALPFGSGERVPAGRPSPAREAAKHPPRQRPYLYLASNGVSVLTL
jgi:hypothetical protein